MRTVCGKDVHAAGGNPGSEICKGNFRRRGGGADFRVLGIDDMAAVAVRALVPCQEAMVNNLIVSGQGDSERLTVVAVQNVQETFPGDIRPLAKLSKAVKVADTGNQGKAESKALSAVTVTLREDTESFKKTDGVFNKDTFS